MRQRQRRSRGARLLLILAALTSLTVGYYFGQVWQRKPLQGLTAIVYSEGLPIAFPAGLEPPPSDGAAEPWRLIVAVDSRADACRELLRHHTLVRNRLAAWPDIQNRLRLTLLAYDRPDATAAVAFTGSADWIEVLSGEPTALAQLTADLGIRPSGQDWCTPLQSNAILVAPNRVAWALIPHEQASIMAHNIQTLIAFVE